MEPSQNHLFKRNHNNISLLTLFTLTLLVSYNSFVEAAPIFQQSGQLLSLMGGATTNIPGVVNIASNLFNVNQPVDAYLNLLNLVSQNSHVSDIGGLVDKVVGMAIGIILNIGSIVKGSGAIVPSVLQANPINLGNIGSINLSPSTTMGTGQSGIVAPSLLNALLPSSLGNTIAATDDLPINLNNRITINLPQSINMGTEESGDVAVNQQKQDYNGKGPETEEDEN